MVDWRELIMDTIERLTAEILKFREDRNWKQFHNPKDLAISLVLEATELLEHFQWKTSEEVLSQSDDQNSALGDELADVLYWVLLISHDLGIDIEQAFFKKMEKNAQKYPVDKAKDSNRKYTELHDL